jgi:hypothetical protein
MGSLFGATVLGIDAYGAVRRGDSDNALVFNFYSDFVYTREGKYESIQGYVGII